MKKNVSILGSTGSIGLNTLKIFKKKKNLFKINILTANKNFKLMEYTTVAAADAGVDRLPKGLETEFNEFAKIVFEELQRMMIDDLSAEVAADNIHKRAIMLQ